MCLAPMPWCSPAERRPAIACWCDRRRLKPSAAPNCASSSNGSVSSPGVKVDSIDDPRVAAYRHVADPNRLLELGVFVAEGRLVVRRLIDLHHWEIESLLLTPAAADVLSDVLPQTTAPLYLVDQE